MLIYPFPFSLSGVHRLYKQVVPLYVRKLRHFEILCIFNNVGYLN